MSCGKIGGLYSNDPFFQPPPAIKSQKPTDPGTTMAYKELLTGKMPCRQIRGCLLVRCSSEKAGGEKFGLQTLIPGGKDPVMLLHPHHYLYPHHHQRIHFSDSHLHLNSVCSSFLFFFASSFGVLTASLQYAPQQLSFSLPFAY